MYNNVTIRNKEIKFRKWKVKDKKKFKIALENNEDPHILEDALVFNCLEDPDIALTPEEYKYVMAQIRKESVNDSLHYELKCNNCDAEYEFDIKIDDLYKPSFKDFGIIRSKNIEVEMGDIVNKQFYKDEISKFEDEDERKLFDFIMHIKKFNKKDSFSFEELLEEVNNLDLDIASEIFAQWEEMKFNLNKVHNIKCPSCENIEIIDFDFMPNFLPEDWFK